jgi:hypothetical protein
MVPQTFSGSVISNPMLLLVIDPQSKTGGICDGPQYSMCRRIPWRNLHECERKFMAFPIYVLAHSMLETICKIDNIIVTVVTTVSNFTCFQPLVASTTLFYVFLEALKISFLFTGQRPRHRSYRVMIEAYS